MIIDCSEMIPDRLSVGRLIRPEDVRLLVQMGIADVSGRRHRSPYLEVLEEYSHSLQGEAR